MQIKKKKKGLAAKHKAGSGATEKSVLGVIKITLLPNTSKKILSNFSKDNVLNMMIKWYPTFFRLLKNGTWYIYTFERECVSTRMRV